jgi:carboxylesterase
MSSHFGNEYSFTLRGGRIGVLLLHGLGGTPVEMRDMAVALNDAGYTVSCPQLAGHCRTYDDLKVVRWQDWAASAQAALHELSSHCDTIVVGGLSMGAILSLHIAAENPALVAGTMLFAPTIWLNGWVIPVHAYLFNLVYMKWCANMFDFPDLPPHGVKDPDIRTTIASALYSGDPSRAGVPVTPGGAVLEHRWMVNSMRRRIKSIKQPALIIHPREDDYADLNNISYLMRNLGGMVETHTLDDCYHIVTVDRQKHLVAEKSVNFIENTILRDARLDVSCSSNALPQAKRS